MKDPSRKKAAALSAHLDQRLYDGLAVLRQAFAFATDVNSSPWDFAVEVQSLKDRRVSITDLRWLVTKGWIKHGNEISVYGDSQRTFNQSEGLNFLDKSCVILTVAGNEHFLNVGEQLDVEQALKPQNKNCVESIGRTETRAGLDIGRSTPQWNSTRRELTFGELMVKHYRVPAKNQVLILKAFEEQSWCQFIDDPLPSIPTIIPKTRLHDTINRLNGRQQNQLIRFRGNGNGTGVSWELTDANI